MAQRRERVIGGGPRPITGVADLAGARVLVAGARVTGAAAARTLVELGAEVTVTDSAADQLRTLRGEPWSGGRGVRLEAGLTAPPPGIDLVVTSPGFRPDSPLLLAARQRQVPVVGDVSLARWVDLARPDPADWLVVTGTNGKTTTVGMLASILRAAGMDAVACGNIGLPVLDAVRGGHRVLAVELSSFQLHWSPGLAPRAAAVLNLADDHLDWHGSMVAYAAAKGAVYRDCATAVVNLDDDWSVRLAGGRDRVGFGLREPGHGELGVLDGRLVDRARTAVPEPGPGPEREPGAVVLAEVTDVRPAGPHNVSNALAAAALARSVGVPARAVAVGLRAYTPAGHRGVVVGEHGGVRFVDDSKATNPHAARAALLAHQRVVWVAGGLLKGAEVGEMIREVRDRLVGAVLLGSDREIIAQALARHAPDVPVVTVDARDHEVMTQVVAAAAGLASPGDVVLLAPAAASLDMFTDYGQRGRAFAAAVAALRSAERSAEV